MRERKNLVTVFFRICVRTKPLTIMFATTAERYRTLKDKITMNAIDRDTELEHVNTAYFLENTLVALAEKQQSIEQARPERPQAPVRPVISLPRFEKETYPSTSISKTAIPKPPFPKKWLNAIIGLLAIMIIIPMIGALVRPLMIYMMMVVATFFWVPPVLIIFCLVKGFSERKKSWEAAREAAEKKLSKSKEYKRMRAEIQERNRQRRQELERQIAEKQEAATEKYEMVLLPKYEEELALYENDRLPQWEKERAEIQTAISETQATLQEVYDQNVIPAKYRNLDALTFLSSFMGTSRYDLKFAIERYDNDIDQLIARENLEVNRAIAHMTGIILQQQQYTNYLQTQSLEYLENGNGLLKQTRNWSVASTALIGFDLIHTLRQK